MIRKTHKKLSIVIIVLLSAAYAAGCGGYAPGAQQEQTGLVVFAAASLTETLEEIAVLYTEKNPDVRLIFNFDSSGTLKTQIQEGAPCDIFISAGQRQTDRLDINAGADINTGGLDFIESGARFDILENRVVLVVAGGNPMNIKGFDDWAGMLSGGEILTAMGNSDVPVGQYTQQILEYYGLSEDELAASGVISYGSNVKEVATQISEGSVDCGIIYYTDAFSAGLEIVDYATEDMCSRVIYPAAVINGSYNSRAARDFLEFLTTPEAMKIFEKVGFTKP